MIPLLWIAAALALGIALAGFVLMEAVGVRGTLVAAAVVTDLPPLVKWSTAIIAGGGISGLATAYYLQESAKASGRALSFALLESDRRAGGKVFTADSTRPWAEAVPRDRT